MSCRIISAKLLYFVICSIVFHLYNQSLIYAENIICWPFNLVPYVIDPKFTLYERNYIKQQISKINKNTCVYWSDINETISLHNVINYAGFIKGWPRGPCKTDWIYTTREKPWSVAITLSDHCFATNAVLHEIVHALGFVHEQQRVDRDCYVWVSEIAAKHDRNYKIDSAFAIPNIDRFPYDKESIMHYPRTSEMQALTERFYEWEPLGNDEERLTELDVWKIQYRFCGRPHYCEVHPQHCKDMEQKESEMNCKTGAVAT